MNKNPPPATIATVAHSTCENAIFIDTTPPDTTITSAKDGQNNNVPNGGNNPTNSVTFEFTGTDNVDVDHFVCQLTGPTPSAASTCTSPKSYTGLADGSYTFSVFAVDPAGNDDLSPATWDFTVAVVPDTTIAMPLMVKARCIANGGLASYRLHDIYLPGIDA